jgi:glycosyltransferase involved in cell wall biosynthesis
MAAGYATIANLLSDQGYRVETRFGRPGGGVRGRVARQFEYVNVADAIARTRPRVAIVSSADSALASVLPRRGTRLVPMSDGIEHLARMSADNFGYGQDHFKWGHRHIREPLLKLAFRRADASVVLSRSQKQFVVDSWGVDPALVHVLPHSIEDSFHRDQGLPRVHRRVLWIGQWAGFKGRARLVHVIQEVGRAFPDASFVLAGVRVDEHIVRSAFNADVQDQLTVLPLVERAEMAELVATAHAGLVTSHFEGFGKMILEMLAGGVPVVSSRVGAAEDYIISGSSGFLYEDEGEAVEQLSGLIAHPFRSDMSDKARKSVMCCQRDVVSGAWSDLIRGLIS